jgi:hypothetical protein
MGGVSTFFASVNWLKARERDVLASSVMSGALDPQTAFALAHVAVTDAQEIDPGKRRRLR